MKKAVILDKLDWLNIGIFQIYQENYMISCKSKAIGLVKICFILVSIKKLLTNSYSSVIKQENRM